MIPVQVSINKNDIIFRNGDDEVVYKTDTNAFLENTGMTIKNIRLPLISEKVFYLKLNDEASIFTCGNSLNNILLEVEKEISNGVLIIDFDGVEEISSYFLKKYTQFLLETSNKVITINMNTSISYDFGLFISANIKIKTEEDE